MITDREVLDAVKTGRWVELGAGEAVSPGDIIRRVEIVTVAPKTGWWRLFRMFPEDIVTETVERLVSDQ
jgi:hypothetical protein